MHLLDGIEERYRGHMYGFDGDTVRVRLVGFVAHHVQYVPQISE